MKKVISSVVLLILIMQIATTCLATESDIKNSENDVNNPEKENVVETDVDETKEKEEIPTIGTEIENNKTESESENESKTEDVWTDFSNAKVTIETSSQGANHFAEYHLKFSDVKLEESGRSYKILLTHSADKPQIEYGKIEGAFIINMKSNGNIDQYLEENGDIYCHVAEEIYDTRKAKIVFSKKLERPAENKLHDRLVCYFFHDRTSSFYYGPKKSDTVRKINLKIGTIDDKNILLSIKNGEKDCLEKLLAYAKTAKSIYTGTIPLGKGESIANDLKVTNKGYYYVYMQLDDENGKYYPVEDISLYQAHISESAEVTLADYLDSNFTWNIENGSGGASNIKDDPTTSGIKYPNTGKIALGTGIIVLIGATYILHRKNKKYQDIK